MGSRSIAVTTLPCQVKVSVVVRSVVARGVVAVVEVPCTALGVLLVAEQAGLTLPEGAIVRREEGGRCAEAALGAAR